MGSTQVFGILTLALFLGFLAYGEAELKCYTCNSRARGGEACMYSKKMPKEYKTKCVKPWDVACYTAITNNSLIVVRGCSAISRTEGPKANLTMIMGHNATGSIYSCKKDLCNHEHDPKPPKVKPLKCYTCLSAYDGKDCAAKGKVHKKFLQTCIPGTQACFTAVSNDTKYVRRGCDFYGDEGCKKNLTTYFPGLRKNVTGCVHRCFRDKCNGFQALKASALFALLSMVMAFMFIKSSDL